MSKKKRDRRNKDQNDSQLDFEEAKDLTVGQVIRKNEEVEAGVTSDDTVLDKYIKQHREEIEADKFENLQAKKEEPVQSLDDLIQETRESVEQEATESVVTEPEPTQELDPHPIAEVAPDDSLEETVIMDKLLVDSEPELDQQESEDELPTLSRTGQEIQNKTTKKKWATLSVLGIVGLLILASGYYVYSQIARSSQEIQSQSSDTSLVSNQALLDQFNSLYDAFYTDNNKTALKNSQFDQLTQLKAILDKLEGTKEYSLVQSKYDSLEAQIKAVQEVNAQFETPAITDGVLDTNAKVKSDAKFSEVKTGNVEIDKLLDKAISLGKSQISSMASSSSQSASNQTASSSATESHASQSSAPTRETAPANNAENSGLSSDGVRLQRNVSRVPYNQTAVNDSSNPAWTFADGVLEQILATSRARGYISGNQYILERVNIVNGNGYYNLYKPDGTYLFTLNCKTGYFVGNGSGHADSLDY